MVNAASSEPAKPSSESAPLAFDDGNDPATVATVGAVPRSIFLASDVGDDMANILSRPVLIHSYDWTPSSVATMYTPYRTYFDNAVILAKTRNFSTFRGSLVLRFNINGTPFHYGRLIIGWNPNASTSVSWAERDKPYQQYQRHGVILDPGRAYVAELKIPFLSFDPVVSLRGEASNYQYPIYSPPQPLSQLGTLSLVPMTVLSHATLGTAPTVRVQIYAWCEDWSLGTPTPAVYTPLSGGKIKVIKGLASKAKEMAGEKYGQGPVSSISNALAKGAEAVADVPFIGPLATAASAGLSLFTGVASFFGFSRPTNVEPPAFVRQTAAGSLALTSAPDTSAKMTMDPLTQITVSPSDVGGSDVDEMAYAFIGQKFGLIGQLSWDSTAAAGALLAEYGVHPNRCHVISSIYQTTPVAFITLPQSYWRGSLVYRLDVVCTQYHSGRFQVRYIPPAYSGATFDGWEQPGSSICVCDISRETTFDFQVNHTSTNAALHTGQLKAIEISVDALSPSYDNGRFLIEVINPLTGPLASNTIYVNVSVRAGTDFNLFHPDGFNSAAYIAYGDEGKPLGQVKTPLICELNPIAYDGAHVAQVVFGEMVASARSLIKRYAEVGITNTTVASDACGAMSVFQFTGDPYAPVLRCATETASPRNTLLSYFASGFMGYRGSVRYKFDVMARSTSADNALYANTNPIIYATVPPQMVLTGGGGFRWGAANSYAVTTNVLSLLSSAGQPVALSKVDQGMLEVELPYFTPSLFLPSFGTADAASYRPSIFLMVYTPEFGGSGNYQQVTVRTFWAAGEDFSLVHFNGAPPMGV